MNNLNNLRDQKFLNKLKEAGDFGYFDWELAGFLEWKEKSVRGVASSLQKRGFVSVYETDRGWYICHISDLINETKPGKNKKTRRKASTGGITS